MFQNDFLNQNLVFSPRKAFALSTSSQSGNEEDTGDIETFSVVNQ